MAKHRLGALFGALAIGAAVLPAGSVVAQTDDSTSTAAVRCNANHAYTFSTSGGGGPVYLNVGGGSHKGAKVITWPWSGGQGNEKWCLTQGPRGYGWNLRPWDNRGLCLDVPHSRYKKGQGLVVWNCNGRKNQDFYVKPVHSDYSYTLLGPWEKQDLKIHRGADERGSQVSLWSHLNLHAKWK
ncbi:RICIN domain-containing protein [Streptomyces formicae]|uniref:Ricin B lectin domain-containing protein n=1 Tax=Streptomyces formicae TaxID=1616117 RepID=A0A291QML4_9ACTN|nr:ricin-type beta-trefoil lectin domain protein [Streptomyces formicae]ATL32767.1 hypothetical protein KY5_7749c [Streptomyces formicae]